MRVVYEILNRELINELGMRFGVVCINKKETVRTNVLQELKIYVEKKIDVILVEVRYRFRLV